MDRSGVAGVTRFAVPGRPHGRLPEGVMQTSWYTVIPWLCPDCDHVVAETVVRPAWGPESVLTDFSPTRQPSADEDGVPFYGPSRRAIKGKSERTRPVALRREATRRAFAHRQAGSNPPAADHSPIDDVEFDTVCAKCPQRLRIRVATAMAPRYDPPV